MLSLSPKARRDPTQRCRFLSQTSLYLFLCLDAFLSPSFGQVPLLACVLPFCLLISPRQHERGFILVRLCVTALRLWVCIPSSLLPPFSSVYTFTSVLKIDAGAHTEDLFSVFSCFSRPGGYNNTCWLKPGASVKKWPLLYPSNSAQSWLSNIIMKQLES